MISLSVSSSLRVALKTHSCAFLFLALFPACRFSMSQNHCPELFHHLSHSLPPCLFPSSSCSASRLASLLITRLISFHLHRLVSRCHLPSYSRGYVKTMMVSSSKRKRLDSMCEHSKYSHALPSSSFFQLPFHHHILSIHGPG